MTKADVVLLRCLQFRLDDYQSSGVWDNHLERRSKCLPMKGEIIRWDRVFDSYRF